LTGYRDWRLPNAKELQTIVDCTRSPLATGTAAIDTNFFNVTETESYYWISTTHLDGDLATEGDYAVYIAFRSGLGLHWKSRRVLATGYCLMFMVWALSVAIRKPVIPLIVHSVSV